MQKLFLSILVLPILLLADFTPEFNSDINSLKPQTMFVVNTMKKEEVSQNNQIKKQKYIAPVKENIVEKKEKNIKKKVIYKKPIQVSKTLDIKVVSSQHKLIINHTFIKSMNFSRPVSKTLLTKIAKKMGATSIRIFKKYNKRSVYFYKD